MKNEEDFDQCSQACPPHYVGFNAEKNNDTVDHIERRKQYRRLVGRQGIYLGMLYLRRKFEMKFEGRK